MSPVEENTPVFTGKRKNHELSCPHKDRKHYAKVKTEFSALLRTSAAIVTIVKEGLENLGYVLIRTNHTMQEGDAKLATSTNTIK